MTTIIRQKNLFANDKDKIPTKASKEDGITYKFKSR